MVMSKTEKSLLLKRINAYLDDGSLEDLLEAVDLEVDEAIFALFEGGLIDPELLEEVLPL